MFLQQSSDEATRKNEKTVYRPQPKPMILETPAKDGPESRNTEITAAEKESV